MDPGEKESPSEADARRGRFLRLSAHNFIIMMLGLLSSAVYEGNEDSRLQLLQIGHMDPRMEPMIQGMLDFTPPPGISS